MNKATIILLGLLSGFISIFFLDELLKMLAAVILIKGHIAIIFNGWKLTILLPALGKNNFISYGVVFGTPFIGSIFIIEILLIWFTKTISDRVKSFIIINQLINIGYLIFAIFIIICSILLKSSFTVDLQMLLKYGNLTYIQQLIFILLMALILLAYLNILAKRLKKSLPVPSRK